MKRKLFLFVAALVATTALRAQIIITDNVPYIDADGQLQEVDSVTLVINGTSSLSAGWYVVTFSDVKTGSITCSGAVHLILADGAKLTAKGGDCQTGIQVSGEGNSLTIYGQEKQTGQLIATGGDRAAGIGGGKNGSGSNIIINGGTVTATGGERAAGIGVGEYGSGSNITINGGMVTATGGDRAAGIGGGLEGSGSNITINGGTVTSTGGRGGGSGIGGGFKGSGSNITINGGTVTSTGGQVDASGIGGGEYGSGSNIFVATYCIVKAGSSENPTDTIKNDGTDIAGSLAAKQYATIKNSKPAAIEAINAAVEGVTDADILAIAATAKTNINNATTVDDVESIKTKALSDILTPIGTNAIAVINAKVESITNEEILAIATAAISQINAATKANAIEAVKTQALADLEVPIKWYNTGYNAAYAAPTTPGMRLKVTQKDGNVYERNTRDIESLEYIQVND